MNINRNNYEEYFLLYADKELSAAEKHKVELFVQQNPDIEEEFVMLQQSVAKPETNIILENKSVLFKKENFINQNNYEEIFLLYIDNELGLSEMEETEKFVLSYPSLQKEFILLQQAKYEGNFSTVFPDKNLLFKKENNTKIFSLPWKAMAAAILLGIGLWAGFNYMQKSKPVEVVTNDKTYQTKNPQVINPAIEVKENSKDLSAKISRNNKEASVKKPNKIQNNFIDKKQPLPENLMVKNIQKKKSSETIDKITAQKNEEVAINELPNKADPITKINNAERPVTTTSDQSDRNLTSLQNSNVQQASYINDANEKSDNYVFYNITAEQFNKSKIGTFLKKVKRAIERKNPLKGISLKAGNAEINPAD